MNNPFDIVRGKNLKYADFADFTEARWMNFLRFSAHFIEKDKYVIDEERIKQAEENEDFREFVTRIDGIKLKKVNMLLFTALKYIKSHPGCVTPAMKEFMLTKSEKMGKALEQFEVKPTLAGGEIVARETTVIDKQVSLPSVQARVMTSITKVADIVGTLADSISSTELKEMDTDDKLKHIARLIPIITQAGKSKMVGNSFTQINLNGSAEDIEKKMLDYINSTNKND